MAIIHVVLFRFKSSTEPSVIEDACKRIVDFPNQCIHPTTQKPYITSSTGGRQNSPEGNKADFSHAFVLEFASEKDRTYYTEEDAVHLEFKKFCKPLVEKAAVVDYEPGVF